MSDELLTETEKDLLRRLGQIWNDLCKVVGDGASREGDLREAIIHVHALQHMIMSQAAGRRYPDELRTLGQVIKR